MGKISVVGEKSARGKKHVLSNGKSFMGNLYRTGGKVFCRPNKRFSSDGGPFYHKKNKSTLSPSSEEKERVQLLRKVSILSLKENESSQKQRGDREDQCSWEKGTL